MKTVKVKKTFHGLNGQQILDLSDSPSNLSSFFLVRMPDNAPYYVRLSAGVVVIASLDLSNVVARVSL